MADGDGTYRVLCKNHCGDELKFASLNPDGSEFKGHSLNPGHDRHVHLPGPSASFQVQFEDDGKSGLWTGTVNDGDHLVTDGVWPKVTLSLNGKEVASSIGG